MKIQSKSLLFSAILIASSVTGMTNANAAASVISPSVPPEGCLTAGGCTGPVHIIEPSPVPSPRPTFTLNLTATCIWDINAMEGFPVGPNGTPPDEIFAFVGKEVISAASVDELETQCVDLIAASLASPTNGGGVIYNGMRNYSSFALSESNGTLLMSCNTGSQVAGSVAGAFEGVNCGGWYFGYQFPAQN